MANASASKPLILIDGSSWLYRAFHALPPLTNAKGEPTGAVYGMGNMLRKLLREYAPDHIAVIFDPRGKTFRNEIYADYKANRPPVPPELSSQFPVMRELIEALGLPVLQIDGVEADDVIGTLATRARAAGRQVLVVTGDKDMAQLVDDKVQLLDTMKNRVTDAAAVIEKFGVRPEQIIDYLALVGDTSDNIPGVPKVGPKTAAKWLGEYGDLQTIIDKANEVGGKIGENLRNSLEILPMSQDLATIRCDLDVGAEHDTLVPGETDTETLRALYTRLGFTRWLADFDEPSTADPPASKTSGTANASKDKATASRLDGKYHCVTEQTDFDTLLATLNKAALICVDTETDSVDAMQARLVGLSFAVAPGEAWYVPVAHDYLGAPPQLPREAVLDALRPLLEDPDKAKLGQHIKYDMTVLARHGVQLRGVSDDSMLESYTYNSTAGRHGMDALALQYLDHETIKFSDVAGKGKKQLTFNQIDLEQAAPYAAEDADITLRLHQLLSEKLAEAPSVAKLYREIEVPLIPVLATVEQRGVLLDAGFLHKLSAELATRMAELQKQAFDEAGGEFNLNSPAQLQVILFEKLELPVVRKTPKGQPSTAEDVLEELADAHALPRLILDYRGLSKLRSTYTEKLPEQINPATGRVHTSYHQAVAATGRLSSSDPNLQNIPIRRPEGQRIRQAFIAPKGYSLAAIDYSQIELRLMAHLSGDTGLVQAFKAGRDIHAATAAEIFELAPEDVTNDHRRTAKSINFGLIYGMSAFGLAKQLNIGRVEAADYIERFFTRYPGVRDFMESTKAQAREQGFVETLYGRRLYLPEINARNQQQRQYAERTAINAPLQGTAADLIKLAMIDIQDWLSAEHPDAYMIMQVHDELVFELPTDAADALGRALGARMCQVAELDVPLVVELGLGANWDSTHANTVTISS